MTLPIQAANVKIRILPSKAKRVRTPASCWTRIIACRSSSTGIARTVESCWTGIVAYRSSPTGVAWTPASMSSDIAFATVGIHAALESFLLVLNVILSVIIPFIAIFFAKKHSRNTGQTELGKELLKRKSAGTNSSLPLFPTEIAWTPTSCWTRIIVCRSSRQELPEHQRQCPPALPIPQQKFVTRHPLLSRITTNYSDMLRS
nr:hypothetical protein Iba_chr08bCG8390 [Ipomoea batatas]